MLYFSRGTLLILTLFFVILPKVVIVLSQLQCVPLTADTQCCKMKHLAMQTGVYRTKKTCLYVYINLYSVLLGFVSSPQSSFSFVYVLIKYEF